MNRKTGKAVANAVSDGLQGLPVDTLTSDNGGEFCEHARKAGKLTAKFYFCHPYHWWKRGLKENANGLIRQ